MRLAHQSVQPRRRGRLSLVGVHEVRQIAGLRGPSPQPTQVVFQASDEGLAEPGFEIPQVINLVREFVPLALEGGEQFFPASSRIPINLRRAIAGVPRDLVSVGPGLRFGLLRATLGVSDRLVRLPLGLSDVALCLSLRLGTRGCNRGALRPATR